MEPKQVTLRLWHSDGLEHRVFVHFAPNKFQAELYAIYVSGNAGIECGVQIVEWCATYESPNRHDIGCAQLGNGRIDLEIDSLRGIGLGALLMLPLVSWIKSQPSVVPLAPINLAADDAKTLQERERRNRFYEKLGYTFIYEDTDHTWGESRPMTSSELVIPNWCLSNGWEVETIDGAGGIF